MNDRIRPKIMERRSAGPNPQRCPVDPGKTKAALASAKPVTEAQMATR